MKKDTLIFSPTHFSKGEVHLTYVSGIIQMRTMFHVTFFYVKKRRVARWVKDRLATMRPKEIIALLTQLNNGIDTIVEEAMRVFIEKWEAEVGIVPSDRSTNFQIGRALELCTREYAEVSVNLEMNKNRHGAPFYVLKVKVQPKLEEGRTELDRFPTRWGVEAVHIIEKQLYQLLKSILSEDTTGSR